MSHLRPRWRHVASGIIAACLLMLTLLPAGAQPGDQPQTQPQTRPAEPPPPDAPTDPQPMPIAYTARLNDGRPTDAETPFRVRLAFTPDARDTALGNDAVRAMKEKDATLIAWRTARVIALDTRRFTTPIAIIPVNLGGDSPVVTGIPIELRPRVMPPLDDPMDAEWVCPDWEETWWMRDWEYVSTQKWDGFLMFRAAALDQLKLSRLDGPSGVYDKPVSATLPAIALQALRIDDPALERFVLKSGGDTAIELPPMTVHMTDDARWSGLADAPALAPSPPAGTPPNLESLRAHLLVFHRRRSRPLFWAGLKAPFDLVVFDQNDRVWAVMSIGSANELPATDVFTLVDYRYLMLLPHGFAAARGGLAGAQLVLPTRLACWRAEPERYPVKIGDKPIRVEVVEDRNWRNRGLMWRRFLPADSGMLFLYSDARKRGFWMLDCFMDMDVTYIAPDWTLTDPIITMLHPAFPGCTEPPAGRTRPTTLDELISDAHNRHGSGAPAQMVLEMEGGWFEAHGIKPGARIDPGPVVKEFLNRAEQ